MWCLGLSSQTEQDTLSPIPRAIGMLVYYLSQTRSAWEDGVTMAREPVMPTLRAVVFAAVCLGLGADAYRATSGAAIPLWALVIGGIGVYVPARYAAGRGEGALPAIAGLMIACQVAYHPFFSYAQRVSEPSCTSDMMPKIVRMPTGSPIPGMAGAAASASLHLSTGVLLGHALAVLACAWWLRRGEAALYAVVRSAAFRLCGVWVVAVLVLPVVDRIPRRTRLAPRPRVLRSQQWLRGTLVRRGPPRPLAYL